MIWAWTAMGCVVGLVGLGCLFALAALGSMSDPATDAADVDD